MSDRHDIYRPQANRAHDDYTDRRRDQRYEDDDRRHARSRDDGRHPYEWYRTRDQSRSPPPRPRRRSPSPRRGNDMYHFGGGDGRANGVSNHNGFSFRSNEQREFTGGAPPPRGPREQRGRGRGGRMGRGGRARHGPPAAHDRKILHTDHDREGTPERLEGMVQGAIQFKDVNELFVSDDEEAEDEDVMDMESPAGEAEPASKRAKTNGDAAAAEDKPKWSNPDPYYLVPPIDESRNNRKDVVSLLRKAKVEAAKSAPAANAVSRNIDFIGFGDEEDAKEEELIKPGGIITNGQISEEGEIDSDDDMVSMHEHHVQTNSNAEGAPAQQPQEPTATATTMGNQNAPAFSHLRNLHNIPTPPTNGASAMTTELRTPQEGSVASERVLEEAREALAEIEAEEGVEPQMSRKHKAPPRGQKRGHDGEITKTWVAKDRESSTPWHIDHSASPDTVYW